MSDHNAKFLRGIDKLNSSTHKVIEKVLDYTKQERIMSSKNNGSTTQTQRNQENKKLNKGR